MFQDLKVILSLKLAWATEDPMSTIIIVVVETIPLGLQGKK